jgi:DNA-binding CsgD family transcriptional regulator
MARLTDPDLMAVLGAVSEIAASNTPDAFAHVTVHQLNRLVRSDLTSFNEVDPAAGRLEFRAEPATFGWIPEAPAIFAELASEHPLIAYYAQTGDGSAMKVSDVRSPEAWHETNIYRRFYQPMNIEHQIAFTLPAPLPIVVGLALNRCEGDFDERDRDILNLIRPHLAQSWRRARDHERVARLLGTATGALDANGTGVIVLDEPVHELTPGALVQLYRFFAKPTPHDALPSRVRHWLDSQREHAVADLELARPLRAVLDGRQLILRHLPATAGEQEAILLDEQPVHASEATLVGAGLTRREVEVLSLLGSGATNIEIAQHLSLSPWTVKRHLGRIYTKLGVRGRVRASAIALEMTAHHDNGNSSDCAQ